MKTEMTQYEPRYINHKATVTAGDWRVKVYTVSKTIEFEQPQFYSQVMDKLTHWLELENSFDSSHEHMAFLILHDATEGIFSIVNWWVGKNMLNTHVFLTPHHSPTEFNQISGDGLLACVWELEVIDHERRSWIDNVLKQGDSPDYWTYMSDVIETMV